MEDDTVNDPATGRYCHVDRSLCECSTGVVIREGKPQQAPSEQILTRRKIQRRFAGVDLFEVATPFLIRFICSEVA